MTRKLLRRRAEPIDEHTPDAELASRQVAAAVNAAIEDLGEEFRTPSCWREIEGLSHETISEMMGVQSGRCDRASTGRAG